MGDEMNDRLDRMLSRTREREQRRGKALIAVSMMRTRMQTLELAFAELKAMQADLELLGFELAELGDGSLQ